jgi:hypothetical protein
MLTLFCVLRFPSQRCLQLLCFPCGMTPRFVLLLPKFLRPLLGESPAFWRQAAIIICVINTAAQRMPILTL